MEKFLDKEMVQMIQSNPASESKPGIIFQSLLKVQADVDAVAKDKRNEQQGYKFRGIDAVYNSVHEAFAKHGVFTIVSILSRTDTQRTTKSGGVQYHCICRFRIRFYAADGSFVDSILDGEGMDSGDKASNKAVSFAHKYALLTALSIPTEDMQEGDRKSPEMEVDAPTPPVQPKQNAFTRCSQDQIKLVMVLLKQLGASEEDAKPRWEQINGKKSLTEVSSDEAK